jgi:hypothetical protein
MDGARYIRLKDDYGQVAVAIRKYDGSWTLTFRNGIESYSLVFDTYGKLSEMLKTKGKGWRVMRKW